MCNRCNNHINENKEFEANLNLIKRQAPNDFGYLLPCFKKWDDLFVKNNVNIS